MQGKECRKYTIEDYKKVLKLRNKNLSFRKIADIVGVSNSTALFWVNTKRKPRIFYSKRREKKLLLNSKKLSPELAYIYGVLVGGGSIENRNRTYRINLNVVDKEFAENFSKKLKKWSGMEPSMSERTVFSNHKTKYNKLIRGVSHFFVVRLASKQVINFLQRKIKNGTYKWRVPEDVINSNDEDIICNFLKGFFDSEGCVIHSNRTRRVEAFSVNKEGLDQIQILLEKIYIKSRNLQTEEQKLMGAYTLRISKRTNLEKFEKVNFIINRKREKFENLLKSYKLYVYQIGEVENRLIEDLKKPKTVKEISAIIDRKVRTTYYHMNNLEKMGKVVCVKRWRKYGGNIPNLWLIKKPC